MGYGKRALEALDAFYSGIYMDLGEKEQKPIPAKSSLWRVDKVQSNAADFVHLVNSVSRIPICSPRTSLFAPPVRCRRFFNVLVKGNRRSWITWEFRTDLLHNFFVSGREQDTSHCISDKPVVNSQVNIHASWSGVYPILQSPNWNG